MGERSARSPETVTTLPMVPLRDIVVFPSTMVPFVVGRRPSLMAVERALATGKKLFLSTQRNPKVDQPSPDEINPVGTIANIVHFFSMVGNSKSVLIFVGGLGGSRSILMPTELLTETM